MKRTIRVIAIVGVLLLALAPMAGAGFWSDVKDSAKKSWKDITEAGKKAPGQVSDDAKEAWSGVKKTGSKAGEAAVREVKQAPDNVKKGVEEVKGSK